MALSTCAHAVSAGTGLGAVEAMSLEVAGVTAVSGHAEAGLLAGLRRRKAGLGSSIVSGRTRARGASEGGTRSRSSLRLAKGLQVVTGRGRVSLLGGGAAEWLSRRRLRLVSRRPSSESVVYGSSETGAS